MTLIEKINSLTWYNNLSKLKEVLKEASTSGGSGIVDAPAISSSGVTIVKFDKITYYGTTNQTDNISFVLDTTPNINKNGCVQVYDINGMTGKTTSFPTELQNWVNSNGITFDPEKNNVIYMDYVNGKINFNITKRNKLDIVAPTLVSATIENANPSNVVLTYIEPLTVSPLPAFSDFALNLSKTVTNIAIAGNVVTLTVNSPYVSGNLPTFNYTGGTNKIKDLALNNATDLVNQVITNNISFGSLAEDNFNSANVTDIAGRLTPIGNKIWVHESGIGTVGIVANEIKLTSSSTTADEIYTIDCGVRNVDVTFKIGAIGTDFKLVFAYGNNENFLAILTTIGAVFQRSSSINQMLFNPNVSFVSGDSIRVLLTDTTVTVYRNSNPTPYYNASVGSSVIGTKVGIGLYQDGISTLNDLIVKP